MGSQAAEKIRTVTSILNGETNHAFDSTEVDGAGFTPTHKKEIVSKLTDTVVPFEGENMRPFTWVSIEEICSLVWGIGGPARTADAVPTFAAGKK